MLRHFKMAKEQHTRKAVLRVRKNKEFFIWCDESESRGKLYSNFYGGVLVESQHLYEVQRTLTKVCRDLHFFDEIKWHKISHHYTDKYIRAVDAFFNLISLGKIKLRIMFTQNRRFPTGVTELDRADEFFMLYHQFIKNAFGLQFCNNFKEDIYLRLYFDWLPYKSEKEKHFKKYIKDLEYSARFQQNRIKIRNQDSAEVNSKKHLLLQLLDIVLGAICFRLNDKHKYIPEGKKRRGKRTIAKEKLYYHINKKIRGIMPGFIVSANTKVNSKDDLWLYPYRHWNLRASDYQTDNPYTNKKRSVLTT
jgi:hypothetical protein